MVANIDFPRGLQPFGVLLRVNEYTLSSGYAQNLFIGDPVVRTGTGKNVNIATAGAGNRITGAIVGIYDANRIPMAYWPSGNSGIGYVMVADDPEQEFVAQGDGLVSYLDADDCGGNVDLVSGSGSTVYYRSGWELDDSMTADNTANRQIRLLEAIDVSGNTVALANAAWRCRINYHTEGPGAVGVGV